MIFKEEIGKQKDNNFWNVLIVDDDESIHSVTKLVLKNFTYKNNKIKFYSAYNIDETKELLNQGIDFSLILLDIVMEKDDAGLILVKYIREELKNLLVRIILRTGQPGIYPEEKIIIDYDINDYKEKTELTSIKLNSSVISSLRSYEELKKIKEHEKILEEKVQENIVELRKKDKQLQYQNRIAQHSNLLNMLAHQWRQPLSIISVNANNLIVDIELDSIDKDVFRELSNNIVNTTQLLSKQIDDFITHYKPSSLKSDVSLGELFKNVITLLSKRVESSHITIINEIDKDIKVNVYKSELEQILMHIIENSIEAYEKNEIENRVIKLKTEKKEKKLLISIEDEAGGLSDEIKEKVFIPYFSTKEERNDTGLGLYMSKLLIEEHEKGIFNLFNKGKGCTCQIILNLDE